MLEHYEKKQSEIFYLTTNEINVSIIDESFYQETNSYYVKIKSEVTRIDFVKTQVKDFELDKNESNFSYSKEMEQPVSKIINPGYAWMKIDLAFFKHKTKIVIPLSIDYFLRYISIVSQNDSHGDNAIISKISVLRQSL